MGQSFNNLRKKMSCVAQQMAAKKTQQMLKEVQILELHQASQVQLREHDSSSELMVNKESN